MEKIDFRSAIARQPQMLDEARPLVALAVRQALDTDAPARRLPPVLTGIGASYYAGLTALPYWHALGLAAQCYSSGELYGASSNIADLIVAISASGRSVEPIAVLDRFKSARSIGIACEQDNPLTPHVDAMIASHCSIDSSPNTASFLGGLQVLGLLAEAMAGVDKDWSNQHEALKLVLETGQQPIEAVAGALAGKKVIDCVGNGADYGIAGYSALLLREFARIPAQSWATHNFLHGPMESNDQTTAAIIFGDGREVDLARDMAGFGITTLLFSSRADLTPAPGFHPIQLPRSDHPMVSAMAAATAAQLLIVAIAEARGFSSCTFRYRQADTKVPMGT